MAVFREVTVGNKLLPQGISEGYAKARLWNRKIKTAVQDFVQIQRNIVEFFTNIIRYERELSFIYFPFAPGREIKKPPRRAVLQP
ncbi:hypothetical protein [Massilia sp. GCM10023247]|uniref:hypothetical protein n=1 Tax=Massilia sp. GCM10023247 TaxID=3252643 RepID=UPI003610B9A7